MAGGQSQTEEIAAAVAADLADQSVVIVHAGPRAFAEKMGSAEKVWMWKMGLRIAILICDIIVIGCSGWLLNNRDVGVYSRPYAIWFSDREYAPYILILALVSFVWTLIALLIPILRKCHRPVVPGAAVGIELVLCLFLAMIVFLSVMSTSRLARWGSNPEMLQTQNWDGGHYKLAPNNTWIYVQDNPSSPTSGDWKRECESMGWDCAKDDAFVNQVWSLMPRRLATDVTMTAALAIGFVVHFALFVWACVDTHRRIRAGAYDGEALAKALHDLEKKGLVTIHHDAGAGKKGAPADTVK